MNEGISPAERVKINQLVFRLGMTAIPSDTNIMAWVLPVLEVVVKRFEDQEQWIKINERRIVELEIAMKERGR